jgi:neutral ceramidase
MLKAGVARGDITPQPGPVLQGNWGAPPSHSVLRPLEVRAIVLESGSRRAAMATVDVIGVTRQTTDRIRDVVEGTHGIPADHVMVICSHTHCAPATLPCMGLSPSADWIGRIEVEVAACIGRAAHSLCPVTLGLGCGEVRFNESRRPAPTQDGQAIEPADRRTRVLRIDRVDRSILATLFHYACHPTALNGLAGFISPDYPGVARDFIDTVCGGTALFLPGCGGDLRPARDAQVEECGRMLGEEVCRIVEGIETSESSSLGAERTDIEIPFGDPLPAGRLRELIEEPSALGQLTGPWARRVLQLLETQSVPRTRSTEMQSISVGPLTCVGIPGEPLQAIGRALEQHLLGVSGPRTVWPVGYANDQIGYFCTERQHAEGGYEPTAYPFFDEPAPFLKEEDVILDTARRLLRDGREAR